MSMMNSKFAMKSVLMMGAAAGMMMASGGARAQSSGYTFTAISAPLGTGGTFAQGINDSGQIVGYYYGGSGASGFIDTNGTFTTVGGSTRNYPQGINNNREITGYYQNMQSFTDTNGTFTTINGGAGGTQAQGINDSGQIVGMYVTYPGNGGYNYSGFLDTNGTFTAVNAPLGTKENWIWDINNSGQIVGAYEDSSGATHGFIDTNGTFTTINDPLGADGTDAYGINDIGQIVGAYVDISGATHGFLDTNGTFMTIFGPGSSAVGINNAGLIVGHDSTGSFLATPDATSTDGAPLPVTGGTLPGALVLLGWLGRRVARRTSHVGGKRS